MRLPNCSSIRRLISRVLVPTSYSSIMRSIRQSARIRSRFLTITGSNVVFRSRDVQIDNSPLNSEPACSCNRCGGCRPSALPHPCEHPSCFQGQHSTDAPPTAQRYPLPKIDLPSFNCSRAFTLKSLKLNSSIKNCVKQNHLKFCLTQLNLRP